MPVEPSLTIRRRIKAPPARVYAAFVEPAVIMRWFGPEGAETLSAETEPRVGGRFHIAFTTPDGERHYVSGEYREVIPAQRLAFTWMWRTMPERESLVTLIFIADGQGTVLTLTHERFFDEPARDRHGEGWGGALDKLERLLSEEAGEGVSS